mgnify:CR=1 FL=1|jgi:hypothetical protein
MNNVTRFPNTRRKLDWKQEEQLNTGKKRDQQRRDDRKVGRQVKAIGEEE